MTHDERCIDRTTCEGMIDARDRVIAEQAAEIAMLRARDGALETADQWIAHGARREKELLAEIAELRAALLPFGTAKRPGGVPVSWSSEQLPDQCLVAFALPVSAWKRAASLTGA